MKIIQVSIGVFVEGNQSFAIDEEGFSRDLKKTAREVRRKANHARKKETVRIRFPNLSEIQHNGPRPLLLIPLSEEQIKEFWEHYLGKKK